LSDYNNLIFASHGDNEAMFLKCDVRKCLSLCDVRKCLSQCNVRKCLSLCDVRKCLSQCDVRKCLSLCDVRKCLSQCNIRKCLSQCDVRKYLSHCDIRKVWHIATLGNVCFSHYDEGFLFLRLWCWSRFVTVRKWVMFMTL
jgi:hypothetical protein